MLNNKSREIHRLWLECLRKIFTLTYKVEQKTWSSTWATNIDVKVTVIGKFYVNVKFTVTVNSSSQRNFTVNSEWKFIFT